LEIVLRFQVGLLRSDSEVGPSLGRSFFSSKRFPWLVVDWVVRSESLWRRWEQAAPPRESVWGVF
jgi:hypothetical protein